MIFFSERELSVREFWFVWRIVQKTTVLTAERVTGPSVDCSENKLGYEFAPLLCIFSQVCHRLCP